MLLKSRSRDNFGESNLQKSNFFQQDLNSSTISKRKEIDQHEAQNFDRVKESSPLSKKNQDRIEPSFRSDSIQANLKSITIVEEKEGEDEEEHVLKKVKTFDQSRQESH